MKAPGVRAKEKGTKLKRGAATQVVTYPRPGTKAVLVRASQMAKESLSSFMINSALKRAEVLLGRSIAKLVPESEIRQYV
jgi:uncharacterized protein (DUF1778 family)